LLTLTQAQRTPDGFYVCTSTAVPFVTWQTGRQHGE
jgi:hypothetical protein